MHNQPPLQPTPPDGLHPLVLARVADGIWPHSKMAQAALTLESALYKALEARGHRVEAGEVFVGEELLSFAIAEPFRRTQVRLRRGDPGYRRGEDTWRSELVPSGRLTVIVSHSAGSRPMRRWSYRSGRSLENQVDGLVRKFERLVQEIAENRIRYQQLEKETERSYRQMAARYRWDLAAEERPERLRAMTSNWHEAQRLSRFLDALEAHLAQAPSRALSKWLDWARDYVEQLDPFSVDNMADLRDHAKILAKPKRGEPDPYEGELRAIGALDKYL